MVNWYENYRNYLKKKIFKNFGILEARHEEEFEVPPFKYCPFSESG